jgi:hypothetical protein
MFTCTHIDVRDERDAVEWHAVFAGQDGVGGMVVGEPGGLLGCHVRSLPHRFGTLYACHPGPR